MKLMAGRKWIPSRSGLPTQKLEPEEIATEIKNHGRIDAVSQVAQRLVEEGHFATDEVKAKLGNLHDHWDQLKERCNQWRKKLEGPICENAPSETGIALVRQARGSPEK